jgi:ankyrin repeat protein
MLLENGAHPNMTDTHGAVPLHYVSSLSGYDIAVARVLLEHGANIDSENSDGGAPLILATGWGYEAAVRVLLK